MCALSMESSNTTAEIIFRLWSGRMTTNECYEQSLLARLNEVERTREWLECELREVRNRIQRDGSQMKDFIDWSGDKPKFNNIGEWIK